MKIYFCFFLTQNVTKLFLIFFPELPFQHLCPRSLYSSEKDTEHHQRWPMFSSWFVARSLPSFWVARRPTLWRCLRRCSPASWGKRRRGWRSFSSVTMPRKVISLTKLKSCKMYPPKNWTMLHPWNPLVFYRAFASRCLPEQLSLLGMVKLLR